MSLWEKFGLRKIDNQAVNGLLGVTDSLAYKVHEIEAHFHNSELWYGNDDTLPTNGNADRDSITAWRLTAGTSEAYGTEVQIHDGTVFESGDTVKKFDFHRIYIDSTNSDNNNFKIQFYYGTGTFAQATLFTEVVFQSAANTSESFPLNLLSPRITCNNKLWARCGCQADSKTIDFLIGIHVYDA
jgi:hypothetical protein